MDDIMIEPPPNIIVSAAMLTVIMCAVAKTRQNQRRKSRTWWMRPSLKRRLDYGPEDMLRSYREDDTDPVTGDLHLSGQYKNFTRMSCIDFEVLVGKISPILTPPLNRGNRFRKRLSATDSTGSHRYAGISYVSDLSMLYQ